jgi:hypothetical protein
VNFFCIYNLKVHNLQLSWRVEATYTEKSERKERRYKYKSGYHDNARTRSRCIRFRPFGRDHNGKIYAQLEEKVS